MGCVDSNSDMGATRELAHINNQTQQKNNLYIQQKMLRNSHLQKVKTRQNLALSDYEAFLQKSVQQGRVDYPSAFQFVKISPLTTDEIDSMPREDVDPLRCTRTQLANLAAEMIMQNEFARTKLNASSMKALTSEIGDRYNSVSYHNFSHGFALMQMLYRCFKKDSKLKQMYNSQELTYYMIAGLGHDLNHSGTNNIYEVKLKTELAKIANNQAVLQKMHLRTLTEICQSKPEFNVLEKSSNPQKIREKVARVILATDMSKHFANLQKLKKYGKQKNKNQQDEETKIQIMENLVHACDIGNGLLSYHQYMNWGGLLTYEFNQQTKLETQNNVPVTEFLRYKGLVPFYDDQIGFLGTFVMPLWSQLNHCFPGINSMFQNSQTNLAKIKQLKQKQLKKQITN